MRAWRLHSPSGWRSPDARRRKNRLPRTDAAAPAATTASEALEGQVDIVAWPGYIERGETDKNYDWVTPFEQDTGCKVNIKTAGTSDEMVSLMTQGGYDLVTASGDASLRLIRGGTVQPIDVARVPSFANVDERLKQGAWHFVDGKNYGTPYQWGPNVLMYNTKAFPTAPKSWSVVFEEQKLGDGKSNKGRVQAYDGPIYIADAALYLMAKKPELGIKDPYELNEEQYAAVLDVLRKQHPLVHRYWHDANVAVQDFTNEGVVVSGSWPFQVNTLVANKQPIASVVPDRRRDGLGRHDHARREREASQLRVQVDGVVAERQGAGRRRCLVRLGAGRAGRVQGQCPADRHGLRHQRLRQLRQDPLLAHAGSRVQHGHVRALQPLGDGLRRGDGRPLTGGTGLERAAFHGGCRAPNPQST